MNTRDKLNLLAEIERRNREHMEAWKEEQRKQEEAQQPTDKQPEKEQGP